MDNSEPGAQEQDGRLSADAQKKGFDPKIASRFLTWWLDIDRKLINPALFEKIIDWCSSCGHYGILAAAAISILFHIIAAIKLSDSSYLVKGLGVLVAFAVVQFLADRFCASVRSFVNSTPTRLTWASFLDAVAIVAEIIGLAIFLASFVAGEGIEKLTRICIGLAIGLFLFLLARLALHPSLVSIKVENGNTPGEEALGIISFLVKAAARLAPICFGVGTICGSLILLAGLFPLIDSSRTDIGQGGIAIVIAAALLPIASYAAFAVNHLVIELCQAVLDTPRRIANLGNLPERKDRQQ